MRSKQRGRMRRGRPPIAAALLIALTVTAGIWTRDSARAIALAERIGAGTVYINNYFNATTQSPVGGFKQSGYWRENGIEGMRAFTQTKSVWLDTCPRQPNPFR